MIDEIPEVVAGHRGVVVELGVLALGRSPAFPAELHVHGVRQTPCQNLAAPPVHDRHQVQEALRQRDVGDTGTPQQIRVNLVPLSWQGCWSVAACRSASEKVDLKQ